MGELASGVTQKIHAFFISTSQLNLSHGGWIQAYFRVTVF